MSYDLLNTGVDLFQPLETCPGIRPISNNKVYYHQLSEIISELVVFGLFAITYKPLVILNKSSAVVQMGDRGHNKHGPKTGGCALFNGRELGPNLTQSRLDRGLPGRQVSS